MKSSSYQGNSKHSCSIASTAGMSRRIIQRMWTGRAERPGEQGTADGGRETELCSASRDLAMMISSMRKMRGGRITRGGLRAKRNGESRGWAGVSIQLRDMAGRAYSIQRKGAKESKDRKEG